MWISVSHNPKKKPHQYHITHLNDANFPCFACISMGWNFHFSYQLQLWISI